MSQQRANQDFERAVVRAFFRRILTGLVGADNSLLPLDEVRSRLPIRGQRDIGLQQVPIEKIVGSLGRYHDFDRVFLPTQSRTRDRWVSIDRAHYEQVNLPPVELIKMGDVYFVKDGNHRVSVARDQGQVFVDAYVTEVDLPVTLSPDTSLADLDLKQQQAEFLVQTGLDEIRPKAGVELTVPNLYPVLREHIAVHRWYLGEQRGAEVSETEAAASWYDNVYKPIVELVRDQNLLKEFPGSSETDLYLWIIEYVGFLRRAYRGELQAAETDAREAATRAFMAKFPQPAVRKLVNVLYRADWLPNLLLNQERAQFMQATHLDEIRPESSLQPTIPGQFDRLLEHIAVHRWYLGEQRNAEVPYHEAVASWYDHVYFPLVTVIREQGILSEFPGRTETDLYLWIIDHQQHLREVYGSDVPLEEAAEKFTEEHSPHPVRKVVRSLKKAAGQK